MRWLQVVHRQSGEMRLGMLEGATARVLRRPFQRDPHGPRSASRTKRGGFRGWVSAASAAGHFQDVAWDSLLAGSDRDYD